MRRLILSMLVSAVCVSLPLLMSPRVSAHDAQQVNFTVMTWNVYVGADLTHWFQAFTPSQLFSRTADVFRDVQRTRFRQRADSIADEIERFKPHLIGLQEVALWRTDVPADGPITGATTVAYDFLDILRDELAARDLNYEVVSVFNGFNIEAPGSFSGGLKDVRFTDRIVVLARPSHHYELTNIRRRRYSDLFEIPTIVLGDVEYPRGYISVDVNAGNRRFRFINTHLEVLSPFVQVEQAEQLLPPGGPADTNMPVVLVGDFNSAASGFSTPTYDMALDAGFDDAWDEEHPNQSGHTCCQEADLRNDASELSRRIDFVFVRGDVSIRSVERVGHLQGDRTISGLWPSDHAGVVAKIRLN